MKNLHHMICAMFGSILITASIALADPPGESLAGTYLVDYQNPEAGQFIKLGDFPSVPPDVQVDLDALNQVLADAPVHLRDGWIATSRDGRAFGLGSIARSDEPLGVWIWPHWRNAAPIIFEQYDYFLFVSHANRYVALYRSHPDEPAASAVVDLQNPEILYTMPDVVKSSQYLHVTDDGRWAGVTAARTKLLVGQLDPEEPNAGAEQAEEVALPVAGRIDNLAWVHNGDFLVVELQHEVADLPMLFVLRGDNLTVVDSKEHAWMFFGGSTAGSTSFYGGINGQRAFVTVSLDGTLSGQPTGFFEEEEGHERPAAVSPSGKFTSTYWNKGEIVEDDDGVETLMEKLETEIRRTPLADPDEPLPTWPTHEVDDEEVDAGIYFWLSW